jgi:hypothetical protein
VVAISRAFYAISIFWNLINGVLSKQHNFNNSISISTLAFFGVEEEEWKKKK